MRFIKVLLLVLIFFFALVFVVQNNATLGEQLSFKLNIFFFPNIETMPLPLYFVILVAFLLGALVSLIAFAAERIKTFFVIHGFKHRIKVLEQEVNSLRTLPLKAEHVKITPAAVNSMPSSLGASPTTDLGQKPLENIGDLTLNNEESEQAHDPVAKS